MSRIECIGKTVVYRPLYHRNMVESEVVSIEKLSNFDGETVVFLEMANGDKIEASRCYFRSANDSANA